MKMNKQEMVFYFTFILAVIFFVWCLVMLTLIGIGMAFDLTAAGMTAVGTFLAGLCCLFASSVFAAEAVVKGEKEPEIKRD
jgi:apolipoprotein N-acyltransferase